MSMEGMTFTVQKDFWQYVAAKRITRDQVMKMTAENRWKFFLRWKHGMSDHNVNEEFEMTKRMLYKRDKDVPLDNIPLDWRGWIKNERDFEHYCQGIKNEIGLGPPPPKDPVTTQDAEIGELVEAVGGTLIQEGTKR